MSVEWKNLRLLAIYGALPDDLRGEASPGVLVLGEAVLRKTAFDAWRDLDPGRIVLVANVKSIPGAPVTPGWIIAGEGAWIRFTSDGERLWIHTSP